MRLYRWIAGTVALLFVFGPVLVLATGERPEAFENRPLAEAPDPGAGWDALDALAPWASDHLPGRERAVRANAWLDYHLLGTLPSAAGGTPAASAAATGEGALTPRVLRGKDDVLYLGQDFDRACEDRGKYRRSLTAIADVAQLIEDSGRDVVFFIGPNKSSVDSADLPRFLPTGSCAADAIRAQNKALDSFRHPLYVPTRLPLAELSASGDQPFWRTDTHWSSVGTAELARRLAGRLDPALAERLRTTEGERSRTGDLTLLAGLDFDETAPSADVGTDAVVEETADSDHFDEGAPVYGTHRWTTTPGTGLVKGRTMLVGDSFTYFALGNLRPLFAAGEFLWMGHPSTRQDVIEGIVAADTVVLSTVQRNITRNMFTSAGFERDLAEALATSRR